MKARPDDADLGLGQLHQVPSPEMHLEGSGREGTKPALGSPADSGQMLNRTTHEAKQNVCASAFRTSLTVPLFLDSTHVHSTSFELGPLLVQLPVHRSGYSKRFLQCLRRSRCGAGFTRRQRASL